MEWLKLLLRVASLALPAAYRARWLEESTAVLYDVYGWRRWWYAVDTAFKAPLLAREYQRAPVLPPRWITVISGATLVGMPIVVVGGIYLGNGMIRPEVALSMLAAPLPTVAARSFLAASRGGGAVRYLGAALLTAAVALGAVGPYSAALAGRADWTVLGAALVGVWLSVVNVRILRRRTGAVDQAALGAMTAVPLVLLPIVILVGNDLAQFVAWAATLVVAPVLAFWCLMAGTRMLLGRPDLIVDSDPGHPDRGVEVGG